MLKKKSSKAKVLLIYPVTYKTTGLPAGLATLSAVLKENGHDVGVFDTAFYAGLDKESISQAKIKAERAMTEKVKDEDKYLPQNQSNIEKDIIDFIKRYKPDIIGISILEIVFNVSLRLTRTIKKNFSHIPIVAGGIFPSLSPEEVINEYSIDIVCIGEGETALSELCNRVSKNESFVDIGGLWIKQNSKVHKNNLPKLHDLNKLPHPDYTEFDKRLFYKPMQGEMYKMVNISTSRGCVFNCSFCASPKLAKLFNENSCGRYYRRMEMGRSFEQINFQIRRHSPQFIYFSSENFLSITEKEFDMFIDKYRRIKLPFWIQTRIEGITKKRILKLKNIGMHWLTIGLEHGNEKFRRRVLRRNYSNKEFFEKMEVLRGLDIGASINNMIGFPGETRELIFDTIEVNKELIQRNPKLRSNVFLFTPFKGCELYNICKEKELISEDSIVSTSMLSESSVINFPEAFQENLRGLIRTFNLYVRLPEKYHQDIRIAEKRNKEGDIKLRKLLKLIKN